MVQQKDIINKVKLNKIKKEIIVVDDCSTDSTSKILSKIKGIKLIKHSSNHGKGAAIRSGLKQATGDIILIQDADLEYNPEEYKKLLEPFINMGKMLFESLSLKFVNQKKRCLILKRI